MGDPDKYPSALRTQPQKLAIKGVEANVCTPLNIPYYLMLHLGIS